MSLNSENILSLSAWQKANRKDVHLNSLINTGIKKYEPLLYKIGINFGFSDSETIALVEQVDFHRNSFCTDRYTFGLKIWLSKIMVRKCIFKISRILFSQNISFEVRPRVLAYHSCNQESTHSCIQHMPLSLRTVYILKSVIGFDEIEIAEILNVSSFKIKDRFQEAKFFLNNF